MLSVSFNYVEGLKKEFTEDYRTLKVLLEGLFHFLGIIVRKWSKSRDK